MALTRLLQKLPYGVQPTDAVTFCEVVLVLGIVSLAACYVLARRAAKVNPTEALRME